MAAMKVVSQKLLGAFVNGLFLVFLYFITVDHNVVYNLTVRQNVISRYVEVMQALRLFSSRLIHILGHFQL